ncbi:MAG: hypothetical protein ACPLUL_03265, partial [Thermanaerothrix sp.]
MNRQPSYKLVAVILLILLALSQSGCTATAWADSEAVNVVQPSPSPTLAGQSVSQPSSPIPTSWPQASDPPLRFTLP